jgi:hypothetical protein
VREALVNLGGARNRTRVAIGTIALLVFAFAPAVAAKAGPGNNGTVKIHDGAGESEPVTQNEPHVGCSFHLHFLFGDGLQAGSWEIQSWPPTGDRTTVMGPLPYAASADGEDRYPDSGAISLPSGHYKLFWDGDSGKNDKHKTFWVDCEDGGGTPGGVLPPGGEG